MRQLLQTEQMLNTEELTHITIPAVIRIQHTM
jgi:hypothetical protein